MMPTAFKVKEARKKPKLTKGGAARKRHSSEMILARVHSPWGLLETADHRTRRGGKLKKTPQGKRRA